MSLLQLIPQMFMLICAIQGLDWASFENVNNQLSKVCPFLSIAREDIQCRVLFGTQYEAVDKLPATESGYFYSSLTFTIHLGLSMDFYSL